MLYQSALGQVSMQAGRARPYHPQVPGAEFGLGVRWRHALTSEAPERTRWQSTGRGRVHAEIGVGGYALRVVN